MKKSKETRSKKSKSLREWCRDLGERCRDFSIHKELALLRKKDYIEAYKNNTRAFEVCTALVVLEGYKHNRKVLSSIMERSLFYERKLYGGFL